MSTEMNYFHSFDLLRFMSFLLVFLNHIPKPNSELLLLMTKSGGMGVIFFFVLSGFLITHVLVKEKILFGQISLLNFYMRRMLRVWPLFYLMLLFAYLTPYVLDYLNVAYSSEGYNPNWAMSLMFLENYKMMITGENPNVSPLGVMWSLCVEEQFYVLWGLAAYTISIKRIPHLIFASIIMGNIFRVIYISNGISTADVFSNIDYFAYGAIPAYIYHFRSSVNQKFIRLSKRINAGIIILTICTVIGIPNIDSKILEYLSPLIVGPLFSVMIFIAISKNVSRRGVIGVLTRLGLYTYGMYLFHSVVINFFIRSKNIMSIDFEWYEIAILSLVMSVVASIVSYHLFEIKFLDLKRYFNRSKIKNNSFINQYVG